MAGVFSKPICMLAEASGVRGYPTDILGLSGKEQYQGISCSPSLPGLDMENVEKFGQQWS
jgi:hypothetical protein